MLNQGTPVTSVNARQVLGLVSVAFSSLLAVAESAVVEVPFAQAALFAAELPEVRGCDAGLGPSCPNPMAAMVAWRYATNNLRRAVDLLEEEKRRAHKSTIAWIGRICEDVDAFFRQPTGETLGTAVSNSRQVFDALTNWMAKAAPSAFDSEKLEGAGAGIPFLPGNRSLRLPVDAKATPAEAEVRLSNGVEMPVLGFGTWQLNGQQCYEAVLLALQAGYRHIDTAQAYANEWDVGRAIADSGIPRRELFIVTKLSVPDDYTPDRLPVQFNQQLQNLRVDYVDLYMLHTNRGKDINLQAWRVLEKLYKAGKIRALGVSNFDIKNLEELLAEAEVPPVYVQNKFSVYNPEHQSVSGSTSLMEYLKSKGITMMGYSVINPWPFALPPMADPHVLAISQRVGRTPSQVLHRWALQLGAGVIPKSGNPARIVENTKLFDFSLSEVDMRLLNGLVTLTESTVSRLSPAWVDDVYGLGVGIRGVSA